MRSVTAEVAAEGWDVVVHADRGQLRRQCPGSSPRTARALGQAGDDQRQRPAQLGFVLQISRFLWGDDPAGWLASVASAAAEAGFEGIALMDHLIQIPQVGRAWEPIPEPWVTLGMLAGLTTGLRLGTLVTPVTFRAPGILAKTVATLDVLSGGRAFCGIGAGWWDREHAAFGLPFPRRRLIGSTSSRRRSRRSAPSGSRGLRRTTASEYRCPRRPAIRARSGRCRSSSADQGSGGPCGSPRGSATAATCHPTSRRSTASWPSCGHTAGRVGRDPDQVQVTVLDIPVVGRDREQAGSIVERLRGRTAAAVFARRHHAGRPPDHIGRYRQLAERGVSTVFVSLPDLAGPDDVLRLAPVVAAFG